MGSSSPSLALFLVLALTCCCFFSSNARASDEKVSSTDDIEFYPEDIPPSTEVTGEEFKKLHAEITHPIVVLFFAPWCGSCRNLMPTWDELEYIMKDTDHISEGVTATDKNEEWKREIVKVDCSIPANVPVCDEYSISSYPSIFLFFSHEKVARFRGERSIDDLLDFVYLTDEKSDSVQLFVPRTPTEIAEYRRQLKERAENIVKEEENSPSLEEIGIQVLDSLSDSEIIEKISNGWWLIQLHIGGGYARDMEGTFKKAAQSVKATYPEVSIAKLNIYARDALSERYNAVSFPQVSLFSNGARIAFVSGSRYCTFEGITELVATHLRSQPRQNTIDQLQEDIYQ